MSIVYDLGLKEGEGGKGRRKGGERMRQWGVGGGNMQKWTFKMLILITF